MSELAVTLLLGLARTTAILAIAALAVYGLLRMTRASTPAVHRAAWCLALLQGWLWLRLPVGIPWYEAVGPALPAESVGGPLRDPQPGHGVTGLLSAPAESKPEANPAGTAGPTEGDSAIPAGTAGPTEADSAIPAGTAGPTEAAQPLWPVILAAVWLGGMGLLVAGWLGCYLAFLSLLPRGDRADKNWIDQWEELLRSRGTRGAIPMRVTVRTGPVLCRLPRGYQLLVPAALWERLDPAGRLSILRHELAHLERGDVWKSLWVRLLALPHWFNPFAWWAVRRFDEAAEWACDQQVCDTSPQARPEYAKVLVVLGESAAPVLFRPAARGRRLSQRIRRLLDSDPKEDSLMKKLLVLGAALGLALVCLIRFDLVAKEPVGGSLRDPQPGHGVTGLLSTPAESKPAANPPSAGEAGPTNPAAKEAPRPRHTYNGKTFDQWRSEFDVELNPERRTEAIKALAAFGANGYGDLAAEAIVRAMRQYRLGSSNQQIIVLTIAARNAFSNGRSQGRTPPEIEPKDALPVLIRELKEGPPNGQLFAAAVLQRIGQAAEPATAALLDLVKNGKEAEVRSSALNALVSVGPAAKSAIPALVDVVKNGKDPAVRSHAVGVLGQLGPEARSAIPVLVEVVKNDKDSDVRYSALNAVASLDPTGDTTIPLVAEVAKGEDRRLAASGLQHVIQMLRRQSEGEPSAARRSGPRSRGALGGLTPEVPVRSATPLPEKLKPALKVVIQAVSDKDPAVRSAALDALATLGPGASEAVPELVRALEKGGSADGNTQARVNVLNTLGSVGSATDVMPVLVRILEQRDPPEDYMLRRAALTAVSRMYAQGKDVVPALIHVVEGPDQMERMVAATALGNFGRDAKPAIPALEKALSAVFDENSAEAAMLRSVIAWIKRDMPPGSMPRGALGPTRGGRSDGPPPSASRGATKRGATGRGSGAQDTP